MPLRLDTRDAEFEKAFLAFLAMKREVSQDVDDAARAVINDVKNSTFYARLIVSAENELHQKKIIELDARPSDCIAMAIQQKAPILVSRMVLDEVDDASDALKQLESTKEQGGEAPSGEEGEEE